MRSPFTPAPPRRRPNAHLVRRRRGPRRRPARHRTRRRDRRHRQGHLPRPRVHRPRLLADRGPGETSGRLCPLRPARRVRRHARGPATVSGGGEGTYRGVPGPAVRGQGPHRHREPHGPHDPGHRRPDRGDRRVRGGPYEDPGHPARRRSVRRRRGDRADRGGARRGAAARRRDVLPRRGLRRLHRAGPDGDGRLAGRLRLRGHRRLHRRGQPCLRPEQTHRRWLRTQYANGWRFFPLYVGRQPTSDGGSCKGGCAAITDPVPQGTEAADDAVEQAATLGFPRAR